MENKFLTPLRTEKIGPYRWLLLEDLVFQSARFKGKFIAPRGFQTDLASIPLRLGSIIPKVGPWDRPAVIHDGGYSHSLVTENGDRIHLIKRYSDFVFYDALRCEGVDLPTSRIMYRAVVVFGEYETHPLARNRRLGNDTPLQP